MIDLLIGVGIPILQLMSSHTDATQSTMFRFTVTSYLRIVAPFSNSSLMWWWRRASFSSSRGWWRSVDYLSSIVVSVPASFALWCGGSSITVLTFYTLFKHDHHWEYWSSLLRRVVLPCVLGLNWRKCGVGVCVCVWEIQTIFSVSCVFTVYVVTLGSAAPRIKLWMLVAQ